MASLSLFPSEPGGVPDSVAARDRWRTPAGVWRAPMVLLGRDRYDLDAAAEPDAHVADHYITAEQNALTTPWGPRIPGWHEQLVDREVEALPLCWLNFPFSADAGGKGVWADRAAEQADTGLCVAFYGPLYADYACAEVPVRGPCCILIAGRVRHIAPPGVKASTPAQHPHAITLLMPPAAREDWRRRHLDQLLVWDHKAQAWSYREPVALDDRPTTI